MDPKVIQEILRFVNKSDLVEVEIEEKDFKLRIKRKASEVVVSAGHHVSTHGHTDFHHIEAHGHGTHHFPEMHSPHPATQQTPASPAPAPLPKADHNEKTHTILSPMVGTFYRAAGPDKEVYVKVGDFVSKGQTLCMIEAMKLFNEIESDAEGRIVKILVENAQPVEYEQPLFVIELS